MLRHACFAPRASMKVVVGCMNRTSTELSMKKKKQQKRPSRRAMLRALRREADEAEVAHIRERLALPMIERTNFLFVKLPNGGYVL